MSGDGSSIVENTPTDLSNILCLKYANLLNLMFTYLETTPSIFIIEANAHLKIGYNPDTNCFYQIEPLKTSYEKNIIFVTLQLFAEEYKQHYDEETKRVAFLPEVTPDKLEGPKSGDNPAIRYYHLENNQTVAVIPNHPSDHPGYRKIELLYQSILELLTIHRKGENPAVLEEITQVIIRNTDPELLARFYLYLDYFVLIQQFTPQVPQAMVNGIKMMYKWK
jgi:hypothetical protein